MAGVLGAAPALAGPVVREAAGANAAAIQAAVDQFRADLGGANNGNAVGTQPAGRREINWDGGGAGATLTLDPIADDPLQRPRRPVRDNRHRLRDQRASRCPSSASSTPRYPALFATFSSPRLFTPLDSNETGRACSTCPATRPSPAGVTGFGAVFTDVDSADLDALQFYTPDGVLLYERAVPAATGNETLSFLGVWFNAGEVVGRVRIVSGNVALGLHEETGAIDVVAMDDFIYAEPVATAGMTLPRGRRRCSAQDGSTWWWASPAAPRRWSPGRFLYDGTDVTAGPPRLPARRHADRRRGHVPLPDPRQPAGGRRPRAAGGSGLRRRVAAPQRHPVGGRRQYRALDRTS